jgi:hypothetical protein
MRPTTRAAKRQAEAVPAAAAARPVAKRSRTSAFLLDLPVEVLERLLLCLDVSSLQRLSVTCRLLHQLTAGRHILHLQFPFTDAFLAEINLCTTIDKKPLLRLTCDDVVRMFPVRRTAQPTAPAGLASLLASQLAILDLSRLRELTLASAALLRNTNSCSCRRCKREVAVTSNFDLVLLQQVRDLGLVAKLSRLEVSSPGRPAPSRCWWRWCRLGS